jgi:hypothetical protein
MRHEQATNPHSRLVALPIARRVLAVSLTCLRADGPLMAQSTRFTAIPLTPYQIISTSEKSRTDFGTAENKPALTGVISCNVAIAPGISPAGSYLALSSLGVVAVAGVTDDSVTDFTTPAFEIGGVTYTKIGMASNGYAIVGGSTQAADNTLVNQNFPSATAPNNVLAPFWTDLNPPSGGALYIGVLAEGSDQWIVLDWNAVSEFSTVNQNSFEISRGGSSA